MAADYLSPPYTTEQLDRSGIYHILHVPTNREYIGSAKRFHQRWGDHRDQLRHKRHGNKILERSWHFHGEGEFAFHIVEFVDDPAMLTQREQWYIDTCNPYFNICRVAGSVLGFRHPLHSRKRMSERALAQRKNPTEAQITDWATRGSRPKTARMAAWHARQPGIPKNQPLTEAQRAALWRGAHAPKPLTPEGLKHLRAIQPLGAALRRGATNPPEMRKKISDSCKEAFANFPIEKQEALKQQAKLNALAHAKRRHEESLANQELVWNELVAHAWIPDVPYTAWSAAGFIRKVVTHLSHARISDYLHAWERKGKLTFSKVRAKPTMTEKSLSAHKANIARATEVRRAKFHTPPATKPEQGTLFE